MLFPTVLIVLCVVTLVCSTPLELTDMPEITLKEQTLDAAIESAQSIALEDAKSFNVKIEHITQVTSSISKDYTDSVNLYAVQTHAESTDTVGRRLSDFTCHSFATYGGYSPFSMCSDVVDYPFYVPSSSSLAQLEIAVRGTIPESTIGFINSACLSDYKRAMCGMIYHPCVDNVVPGNTATYDPTTNLPNKLPCKSLCDAASHAGSSCAGLLEGLGIPLPCTSTSVFDPSTSTCNDMASSAVGSYAADHKEAYVGSSCAGLITETYLGATSGMTDIPGLAPILPPYVQQTLQEQTVTPIFASTPRYYKEACLLDQRKLLCALKYPKPQQINSLNHIFGPIYMPQMPSQATCNNYMTTCGPAISIVPALAMDCNAEIAPNTPMFPDTAVILGVWPVPGSSPIYLQTNAMTVEPSAGYHIETQCPYGYATTTIEGFSDSRYNWMLNSLVSDCKESCPSLNGKVNFDHQSPILLSVHIISAVQFAIIIINMGTHEKTKRNNYVYFMSWWYELYIILSVLYLILKSDRMSSAQCENDVAVYDGTTINDVAGLFVIPASLAGGSIIYLSQFVAFVLTLEVWLRVVWKVKNITNIRRAYTVALIILFVSMYVISLTTSRTNADTGEPIKNFWIAAYGNDSFPTPSQNWGTDQQYYDIFVPLLVCWAITTLLMVHMFYYCISISLKAMRSNEERPLLKLWKTYSTLISLCFTVQTVQIMYMIISVAYEDLDPYYSIKQTKANAIERYSCIIGTFTSLEADPTGGHARCGDPENPPWVLTYGKAGFPIIYFFIMYATHTKAAGNIYWNWCPTILQNFLNERYYSKLILPITSMDKGKELNVQSTSMEMTKPGSTYAVDEETKETH